MGSNDSCLPDATAKSSPEKEEKVAGETMIASATKAGLFWLKQVLSDYMTERFVKIKISKILCWCGRMIACMPPID